MANIWVLLLGTGLAEREMSKRKARTGFGTTRINV